LDRIHSTQTDRLLTDGEFAQIARETSTDVATLFLASQLLSGNKAIQNRFNVIFQALTRTGTESSKFLPGDDRFVVLLIPGWFYKSDTTTGVVPDRRKSAAAGDAGVDKQSRPLEER
jgi:hypothetical protein